ncbi:DUF4198 domain-containing protein [Pseudoteredinibacter isoporae]|uniref:DUF4198 domain-containing protein n=1 Tax=Pseudoteredinibacter isoporae TaxID=570281 RepID=UPI00310A7FB2
MFGLPRKTRIMLLASLAALNASQSSAHTPYIAPTSFEPVMGKMASFDASFAEAFFIPEAAFSKGNFMVTTPKGDRVKPDTLTELKTRVVLEHELNEEGTYRITTGARRGATFLIYDLDGEEKRVMNPKEPAPEGAKVKFHFQSITRADTYVSRKAPSNGALKVEAKGLQILPLHNPTELFADEVFSLKVLLDNKGLPNQEILVYRADQEKSKPMSFAGNQDGIASLTLPAGKYLLRARYRGPAPDGSEVPTFSHTTTLSVQVFDNI